MGKKLNVELEIRLQEQLSELVETYGLENVKNILGQFVDQNPKTAQDNEVEEAMKKPELAVKHSSQPEQAQKSNLPPNVKNIEDFEAVITNFATKGKISPQMAEGIKGFVQNSKLIMSGQYKNVSEDFIVNLTSTGDLISAITPEEDWIKYNSEIIRKKLKWRLRLVGYDFLDSEVEVGKPFDNRRHNIVGKEEVKNPVLENRVLKIINEGLIIGRRLHINANVIVGTYKAGG